MLFKKKENVCACNCSKNAEEKNNMEASENILILGSGCANCNKLEKNVRKAVEDIGENFSVGHVTDFTQIAKYGVMATPALVVNGEVVSSGRVLTVQEVKNILSRK